MAQQILSSHGRILSFGGGHDYGYPDGAAFLESCRTTANNRKPLVINFDAHLDVRSSEKGLSSGTPFYRLMEKYGDSFDLIELGINLSATVPITLTGVENAGSPALLGGHHVLWGACRSCRWPFPRRRAPASPSCFLVHRYRRIFLHPSLWAAANPGQPAGRLRSSFRFSICFSRAGMSGHWGFMKFPLPLIRTTERPNWQPKLPIALFFTTRWVNEFR